MGAIMNLFISSREGRIAYCILDKSVHLTLDGWVCRGSWEGDKITLILRVFWPAAAAVEWVRCIGCWVAAPLHHVTRARWAVGGASSWPGIVTGYSV